MNSYMSSSNLKASAREQLLGHYGSVIGGMFLILLIKMSLSVLTLSVMDYGSFAGTIIYYIVSILISVLSGILSAGFCFMLLKLSCGQPVMASDVFYAFQNNSGRAVTLSLFLAVCTELILLPFTIISDLYLDHQDPGLLLATCISLVVCSIAMIIFDLVFSQVYYLMLDFPEYTTRQLLESSAQIMKGNKGRLFYICVSFIPLFLLSILSLGVALFWIIPYVRCTLTNFYLDTMRNRS